MTTEKRDPLESFFEAARDAAPEPSVDLQQRILADAQAAQMPAPPASKWRLRVQEFFDGVGGWPAMAGLATATVAGVWIGVSPPAMLDALIWSESVEYLPGFEALLDEG